MVGWEYPPFKTGGLAVHCYWLTLALAKRGVDIDFFMPRTSTAISSPHSRVNIIEVGKKTGWGAYASSSPYFGDFLANVKEFNSACAQELAIRARDRRYDIIHCHDWLTAEAGMASRAALGLPLVSTIHSTEYDRSGLWRNTHIEGIEQALLRSADLVITVSNYMRAQLGERFGVPAGKVRVVYNAVEPGEFTKSWETARRGQKTVLFLGRLTEQKGPVQFLHAAKKVLEKERDAQFVIAGSGWMLPELIGLAVSLGIGRNVSFLGYLPDEEKRAVYAQSDLYVMPSVSEPFGITALEAMASGTPVIVSKTSGVCEVTAHRLAVDFWDVNALAEKMLAVLKYGVLSRALARNGAADAAVRTWDDVAQQTAAVYSEVARA